MTRRHAPPSRSSSREKEYPFRIDAEDSFMTFKFICRPCGGKARTVFFNSLYETAMDFEGDPQTGDPYKHYGIQLIPECSDGDILIAIKLGHALMFHSEDLNLK